MQSFVFRILLFVLLLLPATDLSAQLPAPSPAAPLFQKRPFGPRPCPTPTPVKKPPEKKKPIPLPWIIGGSGFALLATMALLYGSVRRWRSSNLFDRQYRFPVEEEAALRFGAKKCGGHLAKVDFGAETRSGDTPVARRSEA